MDNNKFKKGFLVYLCESIIYTLSDVESGPELSKDSHLL